MVDPETVPVAPATKTYLEALEGNGVLQGEPGEQSPPNDVSEIVHALHVVLAGGSVNVQIVSQGAASVVADLDSSFAASLADHNTYGPDIRVCF
jgi:hypothetical protein